MFPIFYFYFTFLQKISRHFILESGGFVKISRKPEGYPRNGKAGAVLWNKAQDLGVYTSLEMNPAFPPSANHRPPKPVHPPFHFSPIRRTNPCRGVSLSLVKHCFSLRLIAFINTYGKSKGRIPFENQKPKTTQRERLDRRPRQRPTARIDKLNRAGWNGARPR